MKADRLQLCAAFLLAGILHAAALFTLPPVNLPQPPAGPTVLNQVEIRLVSPAPQPSVTKTSPHPVPPVPAGVRAHRTLARVELPSLPTALPMERPMTRPGPSHTSEVAPSLAPVVPSIKPDLPALSPPRSATPSPLASQPRSPQPMIKALPPPVESPTAPEASTTMNDYKARIQQLLIAARRYPSLARRRGQEGSVKVAFTISTGGLIKAARLVESSGHDLLDQATLRMLDQLPPLPAPGEAMSLEFTFQYTLTDR